MQQDTNSQIRRISRSRQERMIAGVAGGLATYLKIDPLLVRLGFLFLSLLNGFGIVLYVILWFLMPNEDSESLHPKSAIQENINEIKSVIQQLINRVLSLFTR